MLREAEHRSASRRRAQPRTPALSVQPETRPPELPALASRPSALPRSKLLARVPPIFDKKLKEPRGRGGNYDIFLLPSDTASRLPGTRCTDA